MRIKSLLIIVSVVLTSCVKDKIKIADISETKIGTYAASELENYLGKIYHDVTFENSFVPDAGIQLMLSEQAEKLGIQDLPLRKEGFKVIPKDGKLYIISPDERGLLNACYALLEKLGCGFYISEDVIPEAKKWNDFEDWEMQDSPVTGDRFLFNWHNFLSGCTGWNLEDWQKWINQANKMRYNGIMVHAYGNNPMFRFEYLGEAKKTGYLNNSATGRDWGNQHINDVRRMVGGEIFDAAVFGANASMTSEEDKEKEATELMQQAFQYAEEIGMNVIFALDFDTWMANPQNIINKLPKEAVFELIGGYLAPNPDHPEGHKYYRHVLKSLLELYPQIDQLSVWHRRPGTSGGLGSIWMSFPYSKFPDNWKKEYNEKLKEHPEIEDNLIASGTFAYGKLIAAIQKARDEIEPELIISSGSWRFDYIPYADAMYPTDVPLLPLDWEVVLDTPETVDILSSAGLNRQIFPIIWAHHDDHRYIGKPYTPWDNLSERLKDINSSGFGIIHWTTHPLDLYFTSSMAQVWESSENESLRTTVSNYVTTKFEHDNEKLIEYYYKWMTEGPMFGRETSDHFVDIGHQQLGHKMESWSEMKVKALKRLEILEQIPSLNENNYLMYQKGMEEFYISFFENQLLFQEAFEHMHNMEIDRAKQIITNANPDEAIQKYTDAVKIIGFSRGEKALVFSLNTRWKADFINLRQQLGIEPVRFKFSPTHHDSLAQAPGHFTYFIDEKNNWWRCLWKNELNNSSFIRNDNQTALIINDSFSFNLSSIHGQKLAEGEYTVKISTQKNIAGNNLKVTWLDKELKQSISIKNLTINGNSILFTCKIEGIPKITIHTGNEEILAEQIEISRVNENS